MYNERLYEEPASLRALEVVFTKVRHSDDEDEDGDVSIAEPETDIEQVRGVGEIVVRRDRAVLVLEYPLSQAFAFDLRAPAPEGFTKRALIRAICDVYAYIYEREAQTTPTPVVPPEQRGLVLNRNETAGQFGIFGHDIGDLGFGGFELFEDATGTIYVRPDVGS